MKFPLRARILASFLVALAVLAAVGILLYQSAFAFRVSRVQVAHSRDVLDALDAFWSTAQNAETGQRGYIITGDESYLQPYLEAKNIIETRLHVIRALTAANSEEQVLLADLQKHTDAKMAELASTIQLRREKGAEGALSLIVTNVGKREMDAIYGIISALQQRERLALLAGQSASEARVLKMERMFGLSISLQFLLLMLLFVFTYRDALYRSRIAEEISEERGRLRAIVNAVGDGLYQLDQNGNVTYVNPAGEQLLGYKLEEIRGASMHHLVHSQMPDHTTHAPEGCPLLAVIDSGRTFHCPHDRFRRKDGTVIAVEYTNAPVLRSTELSGSVLSFQDITERLSMEQALHESEERYRNLVENSDGLMCTHDRYGNLLSVNKASAEALGYTVEDAHDMNLQQILAPAVRDRLEPYLKAVFEKGSCSGLMRLRTSTGKELVWSFSNRVVSVPGTKPYVLGHATDVTAQVAIQEALKRSEEKLHAALEREKNLSRIDFLTKVSNRRAFYEEVDAEAYRARRYNRPMTLIYIDVDNFKHVNDSLGHLAGDDLLTSVAHTIQKRIRQSDMVARLGGDEFGILLPETGEEAASVVVAKIHAALREVAQRKQWSVTFSIGMITFVNPLQSVEAMIKGVDDMMYEVKRSSKNAISARVV
jgi:diguanylate cyclase (GGDEF)-like protein/PAS domain S-box-containing protein